MVILATSELLVDNIAGWRQAIVQLTGA